MQEFQWRNWRIWSHSWMLSAVRKIYGPFPTMFDTWNQNFHLKYIFNPRNPWTIPTLITGLGQEGWSGGILWDQKGVGKPVVSPVVSPLLADFDARKMDVKRGYYLSAEYLIGRHMQPLWFDRFVVGFVFFLVFEKMDENRGKSVKKNVKITFEVCWVSWILWICFGSSKSSPSWLIQNPSSWGMLSPTWIWSNPLRFGRPQGPEGRVKKRLEKVTFLGIELWRISGLNTEKPEVLGKKNMKREKIHGEIKTKPSTTHAQFWWFLFWLAK